ncbi:MAG TPA: VanZ family protein [Chthoniobacterales bacterium]|nr:VanZ family protein [Chthoniobacterales bacterium]
MRSFAKFWVPVIAWVLLIFVMSGDLMSAEHTSRFFVPFLRWIAPGISAESIASLQFAVRKAAHLAEYAILALLLCRALFHGTNLKWSLSIVCLCAEIACVLVAAGDEFRQSFVASRGASPWDVMIDGAGAILGLLVYVRFARGKSVGAR